VALESAGASLIPSPTINTAGEVSSGAITSTTMLDHRLAGVHAALANAHAASSREAWGRRDLAAAGRDMTAAAGIEGEAAVRQRPSAS
jgi:hypothetical protein